MDDAHIIAMLWQRQEQVFDELSKLFGRRLYQTAMNILSDPLDAEETVNDTYFALWNTIPPERPSPLAGFVHRIGRNLALKRLRSKRAQKRCSEYDLSLDELAETVSGGTTEEAVDARLLGQAIDQFLDTLSPSNRRLFLRRYWFADPVKNLAAAEGLSENAVSVRLSRLRTQLKGYLQQEGFL